MILLTGVSGFIGKHLLKALINNYGASKVIALTSKPINECPYLLHHDYTFHKNYFFENGYSEIETIIHAGAFTPKRAGEANDVEKCTSNIYNTKKLLSANLPGLKKIIYLSTLDVYGNDNVITEQSSLDPVSLYGTSKLYCERMINAISKENKLLSQILRIGHVYGPGEEGYQKLIPITIRKILDRQPLQIYGSGNEIRSFIYITDVVKAIIEAINLEESAGPINLAGSHHITVKDLVNLLLRFSNRPSVIEYTDAISAGRNLIFDNSKMKRLLLAKEKEFEEGLREEFDYMSSSI